jgi:hypothetical protein
MAAPDAAKMLDEYRGLRWQRDREGDIDRFEVALALG